MFQQKEVQRTLILYILYYLLLCMIVAAMTEKILSLTKHFQFHKKDKHGLRGFQVTFYIHISNYIYYGLLSIYNYIVYLFIGYSINAV